MKYTQFQIRAAILTKRHGGLAKMRASIKEKLSISSPEAPQRPFSVALYARVSKATGEQNPEVQLEPMRAYCQIHGWQIENEYVDRISGAKESRPRLNELLSAVRSGSRHIDAIMVWKLDRFARSLKQLVNLVAELGTLEIAFVSLKENLDLSTAAGRLMFQIIGAMAEFEREIIRERIIAGLAHAKIKGHLPGPKIGPNGPSKSTLWRRANQTHE